MSQLFASGGQSTGASTLASILPVNIQGRIFLRLTGLISFRTDWLDLLAVQGNFKSLLQHHCAKTSIIWAQPYLCTNSHIRP